MSNGGVEGDSVQVIGAAENVDAADDGEAEDVEGVVDVADDGANVDVEGVQAESVDVANDGEAKDVVDVADDGASGDVEGVQAESVDNGEAEDVEGVQAESVDVADDGEAQDVEGGDCVQADGVGIPEEGGVDGVGKLRDDCVGPSCRGAWSPGGGMHISARGLGSVGP